MSDTPENIMDRIDKAEWMLDIAINAGDNELVLKYEAEIEMMVQELKNIKE